MKLPSTLNYLRPHAIDDLIRIGRPKDGGYVLPAKLAKDADCLLSFGVSTDWNFEKRFKHINHSAQIISYDHTVGKTIFLRQAIADLKHMFSGLAGLRYSAWRWKVLLDYLVSGRVMTHHQARVVDQKRLAYDASIDDIMNNASNFDKILLKMDIEGSEYEVIDSLMRYESRIIGMMIEFHDVATNRATFEHGVKTIQKYFDIVHIHGNNFCGLSADGLPDVLELTFTSKKHYRVQAPTRSIYPINGLDHPCKPDTSDLPIEFETANL